MPHKFESLAPSEIYRQTSIASHVFRTLRSAIVTLKLLPGDSLSEAEIAKQLGVSRQPVREAFIQLSKIGMLKIIPQRGSFVVKISESDVNNARFIREAIEVAVVRRACTMATNGHIDKIFALIADQKKAAEEEDQEHFLSLDDAYHQAIAVSADCLYGWRIVENLKAQMDRVRFLSLPKATPLNKIIRQHQKIANMIKAHDQDEAEAAMKKHLGELLISLPQLAEQYRDLFAQDPDLYP